MKSAASLALVCLVGSTVPLAALDRMEAMPRPIAQAVAGEAVRLAALRGSTRLDIRGSTVRPEEAKGTWGSISATFSRSSPSYYLR